MVRVSAASCVALALACAHGQPASQDPGRSPTAVMLPGPGTGPADHPAWKLPLTAQAGERNRCIDRELRLLSLNEFGDPTGVTYADGHPLGVATTDERYAYVMHRRPDIAIACARAPGESEQ